MFFAAFRCSSTVSNKTFGIHAGSPVIYVAFVISHSHSNTANFGEVKGLIILMVVRGDPANPNTRGLLAGKDPQGVVILKKI